MAVAGGPCPGRRRARRRPSPPARWFSRLPVPSEPSKLAPQHLTRWLSSSRTCRRCPSRARARARRAALGREDVGPGLRHAAGVSARPRRRPPPRYPPCRWPPPRCRPRHLDWPRRPPAGPRAGHLRHGALRGSAVLSRRPRRERPSASPCRRPATERAPRGRPESASSDEVDRVAVGWMARLALFPPLSSEDCGAAAPARARRTQPSRRPDRRCAPMPPPSPSCFFWRRRPPTVVASAGDLQARAPDRDAAAPVPAVDQQDWPSCPRPRAGQGGAPPSRRLHRRGPGGRRAHHVAHRQDRPGRRRPARGQRDAGGVPARPRAGAAGPDCPDPPPRRPLRRPARRHRRRARACSWTRPSPTRAGSASASWRPSSATACPYAARHAGARDRSRRRRSPDVTTPPEPAITDSARRGRTRTAWSCGWTTARSSFLFTGDAGRWSAGCWTARPTSTRRCSRWPTTAAATCRRRASSRLSGPRRPRSPWRGPLPPPGARDGAAPRERRRPRLQDRFLGRHSVTIETDGQRLSIRLVRGPGQELGQR